MLATNACTTPAESVPCPTDAPWWIHLSRDPALGADATGLAPDQAQAWACATLRQWAGRISHRLKLRDPQAADVLVGEVVLRLEDRAVMSRFDARQGHFSAFAYGVLRHVALGMVRSEARRRRHSRTLTDLSLHFVEQRSTAGAMPAPVADLADAVGQLAESDRQLLARRFGSLFGTDAGGRFTARDCRRLSVLLAHLRERLHDYQETCREC